MNPCAPKSLHRCALKVASGMVLGISPNVSDMPAKYINFQGLIVKIFVGAKTMEGEFFQIHITYLNRRLDAPLLKVIKSK